MFNNYNGELNFREHSDSGQMSDGSHGTLILKKYSCRF